MRLVRGVSAAVLAALIVAALYFGRDVFVPIALAILLSFVLAPVVNILEQWRAPRAAAVGGVVLLAFLVIFGVGGVIASQVQQLAGDLPGYEANMRQKISAFRGSSTTNNALGRAADVLQDLGKELNKPKDTAPGAGKPMPTGDTQPIPVEVRQPPPTALESVAALIAPLLHPLMTTGVVIIFVIFTLMQREELRNRLIKLAGSHDLQKTTIALDDAAQRLSRLFLSQLGLNAAIGFVVGTALWFIGIPSAVLWGILAGILRFVPYVGIFISAVFPMALAAAVDPGWTLLLWTGAVFLMLEPLAGQILEPMVFGHSTGLSPIAVVLSATFWTSLWGPIGLVLATPLTICLVVVGRHVEGLKFLDVMFGNQPALSPAEVFYQRMLADDPAEAIDKAEEFLKTRSLTDYYDEVAVEGLKLAQADLGRGRLDTVYLQGIRQSVDELVEELEGIEDRRENDGSSREDTGTQSAVGDKADLPILQDHELQANWPADALVLCVAGRTVLDEAAAKMLAQLLAKHGLKARVASADALSHSAIHDASAVIVACISFLDATKPAQIRYAIRRLQRKLPHASIILGCWGCLGQREVLALSETSDDVVITLRGALAHCLGRAQGQLLQNQPGAESGHAAGSKVAALS